LRDFRSEVVSADDTKKSPTRASPKHG
jgi:hypothetical protein